jgi:hypothetical protein
MMVVSTNMTYTGLADTTPSGSGSLLVTSVGSSGHTQYANFSSAAPYITNGTVYCSFLLNCTTLPTTSDYLVSLLPENGAPTGNGDPLAMYTGASSVSGDYKLIIRHTPEGETSATNALAPNTTNFVVLKYSFFTATNNSMATIYVNPPLGAEPTNGTVSAYTGNNDTNLAEISIKCQSTAAQGNWNIDAIRIGSTWADVVPASGVCDPVSGLQAPANASVYAGLTAQFQAAASGTPPISYQWQVSTNGSTWNTIANATNTTYVTPALALTNSGIQYRYYASVSCDNTTNTSSTATVTVTPAPVYSGVIVSNTWQSINFSNPPPPQYSDCGAVDSLGDDIESCWFSLGGSTTSGTGPGISNPNGPGTMDLLAATNSRTWFTYFTSNGVVNLNLGEELKVTTVFQPQGVVENTNANMAFGLFNSYSPGAGARLTGNSSSSSAGAKYFQGYDFIVNFSTIFQTNNPNPTPIEFQVRTNLADSDMMGTGTDYTPIGSGGSTQGATGFTDDEVFTNVFTVGRGSNGVVTLTSQFTGTNGFNISYSTNDILNTNDIAFDTFGIRPTDNMTTATNFIVSLVKIETAPFTNQTVVTPIPLSLTHSSGNVVLTWTNSQFSLYAAPAVTGTYSLISGAASGYTVPATNAQRYFQLQAP